MPVNPDPIKSNTPFTPLPFLVTASNESFNPPKEEIAPSGINVFIPESVAKVGANSPAIPVIATTLFPKKSRPPITKLSTAAFACFICTSIESDIFSKANCVDPVVSRTSTNVCANPCKSDVNTLNAAAASLDENTSNPAFPASSRAFFTFSSVTGTESFFNDSKDTPAFFRIGANAAPGFANSINKAFNFVVD